MSKRADGLIMSTTRPLALRVLSSTALKIFVLMVLVLCPVVVMRAYDLLVARDQQIEASGQIALSLARQGATMQASLVDQAKSILGIFSVSPVITAMEHGPCQAFLKTVKEANPWALGFGVLDRTGLIRCSPTSTESNRMSYSDREYFKQVVATRKVFVSDLFAVRSTNIEMNGRNTFVVAQPIISEAGALTGVVFAPVNLDWVDGLLDQISTGADADTYLVDRAGTILAATDMTDVGQHLANFDTIVSAASEGTFDKVEIEGQISVGGYAHILGGAATVLVSRPTASVLAAADAELVANLINLGLLVVVAAGLAWLGAEFTLLRWIKRLLEAAEKLGRGEFDRHTAFPASAGELGIVGKAIGDAALSLQSRDLAMQEAKLKLEQTEALFRGLFENSTDCLIVHSVAPDGSFRFEACNTVAANAMGVPAESVVGKSLGEYLPPEVAAKVAEGLSRAVEAGHPVRFEDREVLQSGPKVWEVVQVPLRTTGTVIDRIFVSLRDITHLKDAEAKASAANRYLLIAEKMAHVGYWRIAVPSKQQLWSDEIFRIYGLPVAAEAPSLEDSIAFYHHDDRDTVQTHITAAMRDGTDFELQLRLLRPNGETRRVIAKSNSERDVDGNITAIFGVFFDISELTHAEEARLASMALLEATLETMDQGLILIGQDNQIELSNRRFSELLELPGDISAEFGQDFEAVLEYLDRRGEFAKNDPALQRRIGLRGAPLTLGVYERTRPNGDVLEVRTVPMPKGHGGVVRTYTDISDRRSAEKAMRSSETRYRLLAENATDIVVLETTDGIKTYVSPAIKPVLGYDPDVFAQLSSAETIHADDIEHAAFTRARLGMDHPQVTSVHRIKHADQNWVWVEVIYKLMVWEELGSEPMVLCAMRDVTERQRQARHLERAKAVAEAAAIAKSEFLANMSHELRTPLTGMLGVHDLLAGQPDLSTAQRRLITLARESGLSLLSLVNDILDFSKIEAGQLRIEQVPFSFANIAESCRDLAIELSREKGLSIQLNMAEEHPTWFNGDPTRMRQVLLNLITNAIKFTAAGTVTISSRYLVASGTLEVSVSDTGVGIASDKISSLFERFSQADASTTRKYGGTGLGLAICRRLVTLMGGEIGVDTVVGSGSTFWFHLPLSIASDQQNMEVQHLEILVDRRNLRILLAEDNAVNQEIIEAVLRQRGYVVDIVGDGLAALAQLQTDVRYDLILMDLQMPEMDGLTATMRLRERERAMGLGRIAVIGLTANAMVEDVERCLSVGMDAHVAKPIDWSVLFKQIDRLTATGRMSPDHVKTAPTPVLDLVILDNLVTIIGETKVRSMLDKFVVESARRIGEMGRSSATDVEIAAHAHAMVSLAGQLGFLELSQASGQIEALLRGGNRPVAIDEFVAAAGRAAIAAKETTYRAA